MDGTSALTKDLNEEFQTVLSYFGTQKGGEEDLGLTPQELNDFGKMIPEE